MPRASGVPVEAHRCLGAWRILASTIPAPRGHRDPVEEYRPVLEMVRAYAAVIAGKGSAAGSADPDALVSRLAEAWVVERGKRVERACRRGAVSCAEELCRYCGGLEPLLEPSTCDTAIEAARLALRLLGFRRYPGSLRERARALARTARVKAARRFGWCISVLAGLLACPKGEARTMNAILKMNWAARRAAHWFPVPNDDELDRLMKILVAALFRVMLASQRGLVVAPRRSLLGQAAVLLLVHPDWVCGRVLRHIDGEEELADSDDDIDSDPFEGMSWREREEALRALEEAIEKIERGEDPGAPKDPPALPEPARTPLLGRSTLVCVDREIEITVYGPGYRTLRDIDSVHMRINGLEGVLDMSPVAVAWKRL